MKGFLMSGKICLGAQHLMTFFALETFPPGMMHTLNIFWQTGQILAPASSAGRVSDEDDDGMDGGTDGEETGGCCCCLVKMLPVVLCGNWMSARLNPSC